MSNSVVRALKQSLADQLTAQAYFAKIPVFVVIPKDIFSKIEQGILPVTNGAAVFIEAFSAQNVNPNTPGPYYDQGRITISVVEQPTLNDPATNADASGFDCDEVSETAQRLLHQFFTLGGREACTVTQPSEVENKTLSIRRFYVLLPVGFEPIAMPNMPAVVVTPAGGAQQYPLEVTMKLQSPVAGAAIFFTIDNTFAGVFNPSSRLYANGAQLRDDNGNPLFDDDGNPEVGVFTIPGPCKLRARAYLVGYNSGAETVIQFS